MTPAVFELHVQGAMASWLPRALRLVVAEDSHSLGAVDLDHAVVATISVDLFDRRSFERSFLRLCAEAWAVDRARRAAPPAAIEGAR